MKILMIRATRGFGGAEVYNLNLIKGFKKYSPKTELIFLTTFQYFAQRIREEGTRVKVLPVFSEEIGTKRGLVRLFFALPKYLFCYLKEILYFRYKEKVKVVCLQAATEKIVLTPLLRIFGFKVIWIEHGPFFSFPTANLVRYLYKLLSNFSNRIVVASENTGKNINEGKISWSKISVIKTGIDTNFFTPTKEGKERKINKDLNIGFLGDLSEEKGIVDFFKVAKKICWQLENVHFILVGQVSNLEIIRKSLKNKQLLNKFTFIGFKEDVRLFLGNFDIIFYPIKIASISITQMEAMAMEKVVVTRDVGGNRELVVDGVTGFLFKDETPEELTNKIIWILKNKKLREKMGKAARARIVKYFNLERWSREMHEAFAKS